MSLNSLLRDSKIKGTRPTNQEWIALLCELQDESGMPASGMAQVAVAAIPMAKQLSRMYAVLTGGDVIGATVHTLEILQPWLTAMTTNGEAEDFAAEVARAYN